MSEKFDGIRAYWDGRALFSRSGRMLNLPVWFKENLPRTPLDGELWAGRGTFETMTSLLTKSHEKEQDTWKKVRYLVFDLPSSGEPYESRMELLRRMELPSHVQIVQSS